MKQTATINLMPEILRLMQVDAANLGISRNVLIESQTILNSYERGLSISPNDILGIVDDFSTNQDGKITAEFRGNIKAMSPSVQWSICAFLAGLNLLENTRVTTQKMANLWKNGETICYFAFNKIGGRDIEKAVERLSVSPLGDMSAESFVYFSKLQQFRISNHYERGITISS